MKRLKLFFACLLMAVLSIGQVWGDNVVYTFNTDAGLSALGITKPDAGAGTDIGTSAYTQTPVSLAATNGSTNTRVWNSSGNTDLRIYKSGGSLTFSVSGDYKLTSVVLAGSAVNVFSVDNGSTGTFSNGTWTAANNTAPTSVKLNATGTGKINTITVNYESTSGGGDPVSVAVTGVSLNKNATSIEVGANETLTATVSPNDATNKNVTWESSNNDVATVSSTGVVTAVAEGNATITCKSVADNTKTATCAVTVTPAEVPTLTFDFSAQGYENGVQYTSIEADDNITISFGDGANDGKYYNTGTAIRVYGNGHMTVAGGEGVTISKIVLEFGSGDGSNEITTADNAYANGKWTGSAQSVTFNVATLTSNHRRIKVVKVFYEAEAVVVSMPTISGETPFVSTTTVTLTQDDADAIYYTTDGTAPSTSLTPYAEPFELNATATVRAIAVKGGVSSNEATKTFTKLEQLTTMDAIFAAATTASATATDVAITFNNWVVSGIYTNNKDVFVTDGTKGFIIFDGGASMGFNVGDVLSGTVACKVQLYKGAAEITNLNSSTTGLTVTPDGSATLDTKTIDQLSAINTSALVKIENLTYNGTSKKLSDGTNEITPYKGLFASMAFEDGKKYNVTGVVCYYDVLQIMPRSADDIEEVVEASAPATPTFSVAAATYTSVQSVELSCETDGATIYYTTDGSTPDDQSTEYTAAINVDADMTIKAVAYKAGVPSAVASAAYIINLPLTTMDAIFAKATTVGSTATDVTIVLNNWVVSGIYTNNKDVFVTDGTKGFIIYDGGASMGFNVGDVLSGTVACKVQLYKGAAEVTLLNSTTEGLIVTPSGSATLDTKTIDQLGAINTGALVKIENLTYNGTSKKLSDGTNEITPYKGLFASMAFEDGKKYNVTGVVGYYDVLQIMPRSAADIEEVNEAAPVLTDYYEKVTSGDVAEGTYLIVYEEGSLAFNGALGYDTDHKIDVENNTIAVDITSDNKIGVTQATAASTFYIDPTAGTIQAASGKYIGVTSNNNGLGSSDNANAYAHTFSIDDDGNAVIAAAFEGSTMSLRYNSANNQLRFRYYKNAGQQAIQLYKLANEVIKANPELTWSAESVELTVGGEFTSPTLTHAGAITGTITYTSDKESVATVNENGEISLVANATGTAHITASYAGDDNFKAGSAVCTIKVNPAYSIYVTPSLNVAFGSVEQDAEVANKKITVTFTNVPAATLTLEGDGASAFTISPAAAMTESGDITISASSENVGTFAATLTISDDDNNAESKVVNLSITVNEPSDEETPVSTTSKWVAATEVVDGMQVLIVGVNGDKAYAAGIQNTNNRAAVEGSLNGEGVFTPGANTMAFTVVEQPDGTFALRASNGNYLYAASSSSNYLRSKDELDDNGKWTLTVSSAVANGTNTRNTMQFNSGSSCFACYGSASQKPIALYVEQPAQTPDPIYTDIRTGLTTGNYYTLCYPKAMTAIQGGTLWSFAGKDASTAYLVQEEAPFVAGRPYIIYAESDKLEAVLEGDDAAAGNYNGLYGTLDYMDAAALSEAGATHMLKNNELRPIGTNNHLNAQRAYVMLSEIQDGTPSLAPGRNIRKMPLQQEVVTGMDELNASEAPVKMMIGGQLFILRGEKMYNANGQLVK